MQLLIRYSDPPAGFHGGVTVIHNRRSTARKSWFESHLRSVGVEFARLLMRVWLPPTDQKHARLISYSRGCVWLFSFFSSRDGLATCPGCSPPPACNEGWDGLQKTPMTLKMIRRVWRTSK